METTSSPFIQKTLLSSSWLKLFVGVVLIISQVIPASAQKKPVKKAVSNVLKSAVNDDAPALFISPAGNVGIGTNQPGHKLQVNGDVHLMGNNLFFYNEPGNLSAFIQWSHRNTAADAHDNMLAIAAYNGVKLGYPRGDNFYDVLRVNGLDANGQPAEVDIMSQGRNGTHPNNKALALYVTGTMERGSGVEFRRNDGAEGIGFSRNTIYQTGENGDLNLEAAKGNMIFRTSGNVRMTISDNGAVDVKNNLTVNGPIFLGPDVSTFRHINAVNNGGGVYMEFKNSSINNEGGGFRFTEDAGSYPILRLKSKFIGIGTDNPRFPLEINAERGEGVAYTGREFSSRNSSDIYTNRGFGSASVYASGDFVTRNAFIGSNNSTFSDARLKKDIQASSPAQDLVTLRRMQVVNYKMIDTINDNRAYKKVIAQQVQQVYPIAVGTSFRTLPNVFQKASSVAHLKDSLYLVTVAKTQTLKAGDKIELKFAGAPDITLLVSQINSDKSFTVVSKLALDKQQGVFVYGMVANDVLTVDYEAISMLNVSATQQLAKTVDAQQKIINEQRDEIAALKKQNTGVLQAMEQVMARLQKVEDQHKNPNTTAVISQVNK